MRETDPIYLQTPTSPLAGGEMGKLMREFDWAQTPLGAISSWSPSLKMIARFLLANRFPMLLWWGPQFCQLYNDPYRPVLGTKHPKSIGQPASECWPEIWGIIGPLIETPFNGGPATWMEDLFLEIDRYGFVEETHFTVAYSSVPDETVASGIGGVLATVHEISEKVVGERRVLVLRDIGARSTEAKTAEEACAVVAETLAHHPKDIPFALLYLIEPDRRRARLAAAGIVQDGPASPLVIDLDERAGERPAWPLAEAVQTERLQTIEDLAGRFGDAVPRGPWSDPPHQAVVAPIRSNMAHQLAGLLVVGISPRLRLDESYRSFIELAASQIATAIADARAYEEERKRAEALAELDRAKTTFFSNVSHEFRTPLTLMLGPLADMLLRTDGALPPEQREQIEVAHRNGLRLLKLVNTLLDFSRLEAGRIQALYEPTDLAAFTAELVSVFRSAIERAGIRLLVDCPPLAEAIYVDREMWEKIVFNLLSNAFKFTFAGEITVSLRQSGDVVELAVRDTGTGIPAEELPRLFERFHRVPGVRGRTFEGSGIGLALVQELARLHGGTVRVASEIDQGSVFTVAIPRDTAHLPADRVASGRTLDSTALRSEVYVEEMLRWLPEAGDGDQGLEVAGQAARAANPAIAGGHPRDLDRDDPRPLILLADDNADMRDYLRRLLSARYTVEAVADGATALETARTHAPDLVLTDVMMPKLDGFGLLRALRADSRTREVPVIILSARAGEEARSDGLEAGADDYLIKPFSARELLARVGASLALAALRREATAREAALRVAAEASRQSLEVEEALRISEDRLRLAVEAGGIGIWDIDLRTGARAWSDQGKAIYGLAAHEPMDYERQIALVHPDDRARVHSLVTAFRDQGTLKYLDFEHRIVRPDGSLCWAAVRGEAIYDGGPLPVRLIGTLIDITEQKQAEEALRASEERYRQLADAMPQLVWTSDPDGVVDYYNSRAAEYAGIAAAQDGSWSWQPVLHPDDLEPTLAAWRAAARSMQLYTFEHRMQMRDGSFRWHLSRALPAHDMAGRITKWFGTATDIHEQKQAEQASRFLADMGEIIRIVNDPQEVLDSVAQAVAEHLQVRRCLFIEIDKARDRGVVRSEYCRGVPAVPSEYKVSDYSKTTLVEIAAGMTIVNDDAQTDPRTAASYEAIYRPYGERSYIAVPLKRDGRWNGTLWVSDDTPRHWLPHEITLLETVAERVWFAIEKARLYAAEQAARAEAEEAVRIRDVFLSVASHELKTPLTSLLGNAQLLQRRVRREGGFSEHNQRAINVIANQASRLNKMVASLLDISRIEMGQLAIERTPVDLAVLVRRMVAEIQPTTDRHPITLEVADEILLVEGDELRLEQVVQNLIGNAIKYSPAGGSIYIRIQRQGEGAAVAVTDQGIGIPQAAIPQLFQRFYRAGNVDPLHIPGMGIGLFVVKEIMALHGGTIAVESDEANGTTFTFWLPLCEVTHAADAR